MSNGTVRPWRVPALEKPLSAHMMCNIWSIQQEDEEMMRIWRSSLKDQRRDCTFRMQREGYSSRARNIPPFRRGPQPWCYLPPPIIPSSINPTSHSQTKQDRTGDEEAGRVRGVSVVKQTERSEEEAPGKMGMS